MPALPEIVALLEKGIKVVDFGCGEGEVCVLLAQNFKNSQFVGLDLDDEALQAANRKKTQFNLDNVSFEKVDLSDENSMNDKKEMFDYATSFDGIHDQVCIKQN